MFLWIENCDRFLIGCKRVVMGKTPPKSYANGTILLEVTWMLLNTIFFVWTACCKHSPYRMSYCVSFYNLNKRILKLWQRPISLPIYITNTIIIRTVCLCCGWKIWYVWQMLKLLSHFLPNSWLLFIIGWKVIVDCVGGKCTKILFAA